MALRRDAAVMDAHARFKRAFPGIALTIFLSAVDQTIVATALPAIAAEMGGIERVSWILVAYLVAATCAAPVFGQLGDVFGRKRLLFVALAIFAAGCLGCALAPNLAALISARIVQGFGGGALLTMAQSLIGEAVPPRERGRYQAWIAGSFAFASASGPVIGGYATQYLGWRSVFLVLLPVAVACAVLARRLVAVPPARREAPLRFDWAGLFVFVVAVGCALVALDRARRLDPALAPAGGGAGGAGGGGDGRCCCGSSARRADPLLPLAMFGEASIWRAYLLSACVVGAQVGMISFLPVWLQTVRGMAPGPSGLMLVAMSMGGASGAFFAGRMVARTGHAMRWPSAVPAGGRGAVGGAGAGGGGPAAAGLPAAAGGGGVLLGHVVPGGAGGGAGGGGAGEAGRGLGRGGVLAQHRGGDGHGGGGGGGVHGGERDGVRRGLPAAGGGGAGVSGGAGAGGGGGAAGRIGGGVPRAVRDGGGADGGGGGAGVAGAAQAV